MDDADVRKLARNVEVKAPANPARKKSKSN